MIDVHSELIQERLSNPVIVKREEGKLFISGVALAEGEWKGVFYPASELERAASLLLGIPIKIEHELESRRTIGKVTESAYNPLLKAILFKAEITGEDFPIEDYDFVSVSSWMNKLTLPDGKVEGHDFSFDELSLTQSPACKTCFIISKEQLSDITQEQFSSTKHIELKEKLKLIEEKKTETKENPKLFAIVELHSVEEVEELQKKYPYVYPYYGYPHKYPYYYYDQQEGKYYPYYPKYPEKAPEKKADYGCPEGEVWDEKEGKCMPIKEEATETLAETPKKEEIPKAEVPKEPCEPCKEAALVKEMEGLKTEVENLRKSVDLGRENQTKLEADKVKEVKDAVERTRNEILVDLENLKVLKDSNLVRQWKSEGAVRLVGEIKQIINKHKK